VHHLHERRIIYRDLAADNVGFDVRGQVKIFDFGLAKELHPQAKLPDGNYKLTGYTGSLRYMAPEVVRCRPYNLSADVFSFGILLWVIVACSLPYKGFTVQMFEKMVVSQGFRPPIEKSWSKDVISMMKRCWSANPKERPNFNDITEEMQHLILTISGENVEFDLDMSKRSYRGSKHV